MAKDNKKPSAPPLKIEQNNTKKVDEKSRVEAPNTVDESKTETSDTKTSSEFSFTEAQRSVLEIFESMFPGHANAAFGGFIGFVVSLLIFIIGFLRTALIVLLVLVGVGIGQMYDGDPKLLNTAKELFLNKR